MIILIFSEGPAESSNEYLDPSSEGWIADCFNDTEMHFSAEDTYVFLILFFQCNSDNTPD